jgi:hypothetical protein
LECAVRGPWLIVGMCANRPHLSPVSSRTAPVCPLPRLRVVGVGLPHLSPSVPPAPLRVCRAPLVPCLIVCVSVRCKRAVSPSPSLLARAAFLALPLSRCRAVLCYNCVCFFPLPLLCPSLLAGSFLACGRRISCATSSVPFPRRVVSPFPGCLSLFRAVVCPPSLPFPCLPLSSLAC